MTTTHTIIKDGSIITITLVNGFFHSQTVSNENKEISKEKTTFVLD